MPVDQENLELGVSLGFSEIIRSWATDQKNALDHADSEVMPQLSATPTIFKAAAWLNFGLDGTQRLFPASALAQGMQRLSVPIAATKYAVEGFQKLYADEVAKTNALLTKEYGTIKDKFKNAVNQLSIDFGNTPFAAKSRKVLADVFSKHRRDMADAEMVKSHCANVIVRAGLIETEVGEIRKRTSEGFGGLCKKIYDVYRGTKYSRWGQDMLIRLDPTRRSCSFWGDKPITNYNPITGKNQHCGPYSHLVGLGSGLDQEQFAWILANMWRLDVKHIDRWHGDDTTYVWPAKNPATVSESIEGIMQNALGDYRGAIEMADAAEWPRTLAVRRGAA